MAGTAAIGALHSTPRARREVVVSLFASLVLPSLAGVVFVVTLVHVLFLSGGVSTLLRDSDSGWHIRNGEAILNTGVIPQVDSFSYTRQGAPWLAWEWLSDVVFGKAHQAAGLSGAAFVAALAIAASAWGATRLALFMGGNLFFTAASMAIFLGVTSIHWLARPHVFSWGLSLLFLAAAEAERRKERPSWPGATFQWLRGLGRVVGKRTALLDRRADRATSSNIAKHRLSEAGGCSTFKQKGLCGQEQPPRPSGAPPIQEGPLASTPPHALVQERTAAGAPLYLLPFLACLWANLHGSFLLGPAILLIYALGERVAGRIETGSRLAAAGVACILATFINPYTWRLHAHVLGYLRNTYLMDHISEFRSYSFHSPGAIYVELLLVATIAGIVLMLKQRAFGPALLGAALVHMALYSARHWPTVAVLLLPLVVVAFTREAENWPRLRTMLAYSNRVRAIDKRIWSVAPVVLVLALSVGGLQAASRQVNFDSEMFPVGAADYLEKHAGDARLFTKDQWGGYLLYRFPDRKVFIDGRSDFYGVSFLEMYAKAADARPGWDAVLDQYGVQFVMAAADSPLVSVLQFSRAWKQVYSDNVAFIFEKIVAPVALASSASGAQTLPITPSNAASSSPAGFRFAALVLMVVVAGCIDLYCRRIPNWIAVSGTALAFVLHAWQDGLYGVLLGLGGAALGFAMFIAFYAAGGMGAGDVKLFAAVGALAGPQALIMIFILTALLGGIAAGVAALWLGRVGKTFIPYGAVIAGGALLSLPVIQP